jgi:hypothetical protein
MTGHKTGTREGWLAAAAKTHDVGPWRARDAAGWIGLAATPAFALMAWIAATDAPRIAICASASGMPIGGMAWMYLMMSLVHVSPWLRLTRPTPRNCPTPEN